MTDRAAFDMFVRDRAPHLLRIAYLLTRDHGHAEDLLQTALARSYTAWKRIDGDPEPYVRKVLVNAFAAWRGRRWHGERPSDVLPEVAADPHVAVDDRDEVWRALMRLPRQQRAVVVLRYFEDLPEAEIAAALGISAGTVKSYTSRAMAALRADDSLRRIEIPDAPAGEERLAGVRDRVRRQARRRIGTIATAVVVLIAVVVGALVGVRIRTHGAEPVVPRVGDYHQGYRVVHVMSGPPGPAESVASWTPTDSAVAFWTYCYSPHGFAKPQVTGAVYGGDAGGPVTCGPHPVPNAPTPVAPIHGGPVPISFPFWAGPKNLEQYLPFPPDAVAYMVFGVPVPFEDYPFPKRPARLRPLDRDAETGIVLDAAHPSVTVPCGIDLSFTGTLHTQSPGQVYVSRNGTRRNLLTAWDWNGTDSHLISGTRSDTCVYEVSAEHMTGDWYVSLVKNP
jgi:RNA polymerase sigma-70 factor (sigma-E family)